MTMKIMMGAKLEIEITERFLYFRLGKRDVCLMKGDGLTLISQHNAWYWGGAKHS
jgi:hypothetical protein